MNPHIQRHFERIEQELCSSSIVQQYHTLQQEIAQHSGHTRMHAKLVDGGLCEIFEYVTVKPDGALAVKKYRYHWQDASNNVIRRWDNAAHHPHLPHAPHHVHLPDGSVEGIAEPPDAIKVLEQIEAKLGQRREEER
jgi:hypothetical protein